MYGMMMRCVISSCTRNKAIRIVRKREMRDDANNWEQLSFIISVPGAAAWTACMVAEVGCISNWCRLQWISIN
jgi:hypothetical protein